MRACGPACVGAWVRAPGDAPRRVVEPIEADRLDVAGLGRERQPVVMAAEHEDLVNAQHARSGCSHGHALRTLSCGRSESGHGHGADAINPAASVRQCARHRCPDRWDVHHRHAR
jgi:hypothetical protein